MCTVSRLGLAAYLLRRLGPHRLVGATGFIVSMLVFS